VEAESRVPKTVAGRFELERLLGEGERKRVYLARDPKLDVEVAVSLADASDEAQSAIHDWESKVTAKLRGAPHIVTVYDSGEQDGWLYQVTQYMAGGDLGTLCRKPPTGQPMDISRAVEVGQDICVALVHTHRERLLHRDVQPNNVWFDRPDGDAFLGDFDLAVSLDDGAVPADPVTTPRYMPPEEITGGPMSERSDLYSLGATLYETVVGRPPFEGTGEELRRQHLEVEPDPLSSRRTEVPLALDALVGALLRKEPADRPATALETMEALIAIRETDASHPGISELEDWIAEAESSRVEFKGSLSHHHEERRPNTPKDALSHSVAKTLAAFMNSAGGTLLIGVADDGKILGIEHDYPHVKGCDRDGWERHFRQVMGQMLGQEAAGAVSLSFVKHPEGTVAVARVRRRSKETYVRRGADEDFFIRDGNRTVQPTTRDAVRMIAEGWPAA
jgi:serine/threonine protein kinase